MKSPEVVPSPSQLRVAGRPAYPCTDRGECQTQELSNEIRDVELSRRRVSQ
jgi:hypothetical protein